MTIGIFSNKVLAGDSLATLEDATVAYRESKIKIIHGAACLGAGDVTDVDYFWKWYEEGAHPEKALELEGEDNFTMLVMTPDEAFYYGSPKKRPEKVAHRRAIGAESAIHYAYAVLDLGFNVIEAVEKVCRYSTVCGEPIYSISQSQLKQVPKDFVGLWTGTIKSNVPEMFGQLKNKRR